MSVKSPANHCITANESSLAVLRSLLKHIPEEIYSKPSPLSDSTLGEQVRHILDHYLMLLKGLGHKQICYDNRNRDQLLECSTSAAISVLDGICSQLQTLKESEDISLTLSCATSAQCDQSVITETTLTRELLFIHSHTIHHQAIMSVLLKLEGLEVPEDLGVAPATLQFRSRQPSTQP